MYHCLDGYGERVQLAPFVRAKGMVVSNASVPTDRILNDKASTIPRQLQARLRTELAQLTHICDNADVSYEFFFPNQDVCWHRLGTARCDLRTLSRLVLSFFLFLSRFSRALTSPFERDTLCLDDSGNVEMCCRGSFIVGFHVFLFLLSSFS